MKTWLKGVREIRLAADMQGKEGRPVVLFLHGAGQTGRSWSATARACADVGYRSVSVDTRGHGESDWAPDGDYLQETLAQDVAALVEAMPGSPVIVGASMSGMASMIAVGRGIAPTVRALVLVDIAPTFRPGGADRITGFMQANPNGFATVEEAADTLSRYNPNRPRPSDLSGLRRTLREIDGRYFWHWDPRLFGSAGIQVPLAAPGIEELARRIAIPTLLIRGANSDLIQEADIAAMQALVPHSRFVDIAGAGHMVVGDHNDAFSAAVFAFLREVDDTTLLA